MSIEQVKEQIGELWISEAKAIIESRDRSRDEANALRRSYGAVLAAIDEADRLRAEADALTDKHGLATLAGDQGQAEEIRAEYQRLRDEADAVEEGAENDAKTLREAGVGVSDRESLERSLEAKIAALESQSQWEIQTLEHIAAETAELLAALRDQAKPFISNLPDAGARRQSSAIEIMKLAG